MAGLWSWKKKHTYTKVIRGPVDKPELKKAIISTTLYDILIWHIWAVISVTTSIVLLFLTFTEYSIGGEIGGSPGATANILGALQLAVKAHEITIVASIYMIAHQWIQGSLIDMDKGIPLGLLGAEKELGQLSFLYSKGYLSAVRYLVGQWRKKQGRLHLCLLTIFLSGATVISSLAGPASGVLMIPRPDWFFDSVLNLTESVIFGYPNLLAHPYLLVRPKFEYGGDSGLNFLDAFDPSGLSVVEDSLQYWLDLTVINAESLGALLSETTTYDLAFGSRNVIVNISSTLGRSLDNNNTGRTYAKSVMGSDVEVIEWLMRGGSNKIRTQHKETMPRWSGRKYVVNANAMTVEVNCHSRPKEPCASQIATADNRTTNWCPRDLVLLFQNIKNYESLAPSNASNYLSRVYMTEGPRTQKYPKFTDSYQLIFDRGYVPWNRSLGVLSNKTFTNVPIPSSKVIVCSILTTIEPAVVTSLDVRFTPVYAEYPSSENKTILLFHERWLDGTNWLREDYSDIPKPFTTGNLTLPPRNMSEPTGNRLLGRFGEVLNQALDVVLVRYEDPERPGILANNKAVHLETAVSGAFLSVYNELDDSDSQYPFNSTDLLPESLMPEPPNYYQIPTATITAYNFGYGFRLSSRTGILGVTILVAHVVIVLFGSLWQLFWLRRVISAWDTIPDYVALGLGSVIPPAKVLENTCAGIAATKTLQTIVMVGETTDLHLEIAVGEQVPGTGVRSVLGKLDKYGSRDGGAKEKLE